MVPNLPFGTNEAAENFEMLITSSSVLDAELIEGLGYGPNVRSLSLRTNCKLVSST